jgi:hypothetical protein
MTGDILNPVSHYSSHRETKNHEINSMLKKVSLPRLFDALEHECEARNHQRHEVLERASGIENSLPYVFVTKQVESDECCTRKRAEQH